jgi:1-acyl-sn-glycerol-3-phosphate acyltransferase
LYFCCAKVIVALGASPAAQRIPAGLLRTSQQWSAAACRCGARSNPAQSATERLFSGGMRKRGKADLSSYKTQETSTIYAMLNKIYTVLLVAYFIVSAPVLVLIAAALFVLLFPFDRKRKVQHLFSRFIAAQYFSVLLLCKVVVKGREHVVKGQPYVIASNHQSMLDIMLLYNVPLYFKWVSKREVYRMPLVGQLLWMHGDVCIKRGGPKSARKMMRDCSAFLKQRISIMIFPEGTRSKSGQVGRFKEGAFVLAKSNSVPILPVVIEGTRSFSNGNGGWCNARQLFQVAILPPISAEEVATTDVKALQEKVHDMICAEHSRMLAISTPTP